MKFAMKPSPKGSPEAAALKPPYLDVTVTKVPDHEGTPIPIFTAKVLLPDGSTLNFPVLLNPKPEAKYSDTTVNLAAAANAAVQIKDALMEGLTTHIRKQLDAVNPSGAEIIHKNPYAYTSIYGGVTVPSFKPAVSQATGDNVVKTLIATFPGLAGAKATAPCGTHPITGKGCTWSAVENYLTSIVIHLNDTHRWSRDRIADWLDALDFDLSAKPNTEKETAA